MVGYPPAGAAEEKERRERANAATVAFMMGIEGNKKL